MATVFQSIFLGAEGPMTWIEDSFTWLGSALGELLPEGPVRSLVVNGVVSGVGSVVVFVPQIAILFLFLGILEDSGYLARAAFIMDRVMRPVGLQGRSFIPLLSSFACAIPGILSARTIPAWSDRMATILVAPLMSCSARLPVYTVLIAAFIPAKPLIFGLSLQGLVLFAMYLLGVLGAAVVAWLLKLSVLRGKPALFVMEMPAFRVPSTKIVLRDVVDRVLGFLKNATTVILACSVVLWFLASYPRQDGHDATVKASYAGQIGTFIEPVIKPLGFNWEIGVGILASFAAREVFISSLATVYNLQESADSATSLIAVLKNRAERGEFSLATALSLMVFYVFACQCISTLAVTKRETGGWRWPAFMFLYMTALAYGASFLTYQLAQRML
jgi:ferrous iron transport protein B